MEIKLNRPVFECGDKVTGNLKWNPVMDVGVESITVKLRWWTDSGKSNDGAIVDSKNYGKEEIGGLPLDHPFELSVPEEGPITILNEEAEEDETAIEEQGIMGQVETMSEVYQAGEEAETEEERRKRMEEAWEENFGRFPVELHWEILVDVQESDGSEDFFSREVTVVPKNATEYLLS